MLGDINMKLYDIIKELKNKPYKLGGEVDGDNRLVSFDCLTMLNEYFRLSIGWEIPLHNINGADYSGYANDYKNNKDLYTSVFIGIIRSKFRVMSKNLMVAGDVAWVEDEGNKFPLIFTGNNSMLGCFIETGTTFVSMTDVYTSIKWIIRWDHL